MLSEPDLDNEKYEDILEEAKNIVISMYPEWTDYNHHDPGITLLELFSLMKESQQYFLNQIGEENRIQYLKLLGVARRTKKPAKSLIHLNSSEDIVLLRNNKLSAGDLCFEVQGRKQLVGGDIHSCFAFRGEELSDYLERSQLEFGQSLGFSPFGTQAEVSDACYICFERSLPVGVQLSLYMEVFQDYPVRRNPLEEDDFIPMVCLSLQYYNGKDWLPAADFRDDTSGMLFNGFMEFMLPEKMQSTEIYGESGYFIRIVLKEGTYDIAPVLTRISMNVCPVFQRDTLAEEKHFSVAEMLEMDTELAVTGRSAIWLSMECSTEKSKECIYYPLQGFKKTVLEDTGVVQYWLDDDRLSRAEEVMIVNSSWGLIRPQTTLEGNGFPNQCLDLEDLQIEYDSLGLLIQDSEHEDGYRKWQRVADFGKSSPEDYHYVFDSRRGKIRFGDCIHGRAPVGKIILTGYARTMGNNGNVREGSIDRFVMSGARQIPVYNICGGSGGEDEETLDESFLRARSLLGQPCCAVTGKDYEEYAKKTPGLMIESCQALNVNEIQQFIKKADDTAVYLVIKPYGGEQDERVSRLYYRNIRNFLEKYRLVGSRVFLFLPEYVYVEVFVDAVVKPQYLNNKQLLQQTVEDFFRERGKQFGGKLAYSQLYGCIDRQGFIGGIRTLSMETKGKGAKQNREGDILLSPNAVAVLKRVRCSLTLEE